MSEGLDFSWGRPGSAAIKAAGRVFVCRYLGAGRFGGKGMAGVEFADYLNNGIAVVLNFESSGTDTTSYANGVADATFAQGQAVLLGHGDAVIYFSNDKADTTGLVDYLRGVNSVIGLNRTGLYAGLAGIQAAQAAGVARWFWQTYAWSQNHVAPGVHIFQYLNGQRINNADVDFDRNLQGSFGQIGSAVPADVPPVVGYNASTWPTAQIQAALDDPRCGSAGIQVDGIYGPATTTAVHNFEVNQGLTVDVGIAGPQVVGRLAQLLGQPQPVKPPQPPVVTAPPFPLPAGWYFGWATGPKESVSGYYGHSADLQLWQQRMKDRGWGIVPDGHYGPQTNGVAIQFQTEKHLTVDGKIGPQTWAAAWTAPITH